MALRNPRDENQENPVSASATRQIPESPDHVKLESTLEIEYRCTRFSVTPDTLRATVSEVGPRAGDVQKKLHAAARTAFSKGGED